MFLMGFTPYEDEPGCVELDRYAVVRPVLTNRFQSILIGEVSRFFVSFEAAKNYADDVSKFFSKHIASGRVFVLKSSSLDDKTPYEVSHVTRGSRPVYHVRFLAKS